MLAGTYLLLLSPQPALAYQGTNCPTGTISADPTVADPGGSVVVTVTITDCNGNGLEGVQVTFSQQTGPANCHLVFTPATAVTDANGQARTTVTLPPNCPCQYTIQASAPSVNITLTTTVRENGCLPFTGAAALSASPTEPLGPEAAALTGLSLVVVGGLALYTRSRHRL